MEKGIVYKVTNIKTNEIYVGATTSSIDKRKLDHINLSKRKKHRTFYKAIGTYGPVAFKWEQIDTASSTDELAKKEKEYILEYNSKEEGYNSDVGGGIQKTVYQDNIEGELVNTFSSLGEAAEVVNSFKQNISSACLSETYFYKGSLWSYDYKKPFKRYNDVRRKIVFQYSLTGKYVNEFNSVSEAAKLTGCNKTCVAKVCRGERKTSGGYHWKYL